MGLYHPLDGDTNLKYKLLCFLTPNKKNSKKKALAFNRDRCCHLALCLQSILFHCYKNSRTILPTINIGTLPKLNFLSMIKLYWKLKKQGFTNSKAEEDIIYIDFGINLGKFSKCRYRSRVYTSNTRWQDKLSLNKLLARAPSTGKKNYFWKKKHFFLQKLSFHHRHLIRLDYLLCLKVHLRVRFQRPILN